MSQLPAPVNTSEMYLQAVLVQLQALTAAVDGLAAALLLPVEEPQPEAGEEVQEWRDDFTALKGVGPKRRDELYAKGIFTFRDLAMADNRWLATTMEVSQTTLFEWQQQATELAT